MSVYKSLLAPVYLPGQEPQLEGASPEERDQAMQMAKWTKFASSAMESCPVKVVLSGTAGFALGGFFSLLSSSFAIDDPLRKSNQMAAELAARTPGAPPPPELTTSQQTKLFFKETGKGMYRSAKGFGKVGALYSGIECCIEGVSVAVQADHVGAEGGAASLWC
jgi:import inner membrane translocase subunit TIM22